MVKKVNKFLILFTKIATVATVSALISCSFSNDAKPLPEENDEGTVIQPDTETEEADLDEKEDTEIADTDSDKADETADADDEIPEEEKTKSVVIGTYNTHLFFDTKCDSGNCSGSSFEDVLSNSEYKNKVSDLADSVKEIGADIILLQEIEKESCLEDLFNKSGDYENYFFGEKGSAASVDTAVMTKGKITSKKIHSYNIECADCDGGKTTFSHTFTETRISLGGREIIVFSAHFKSKNDDDPARRLAEAVAAAKILKSAAEKNPEALIVMGGDLNDVPGSDTLETLESNPGFLRVASELSSKNQATYYYSGEAIALDHIFWVKTDAGTYKKGSAEVVKDAPNWYSLGSSDHAALKATFEF